MKKNNRVRTLLLATALGLGTVGMAAQVQQVPVNATTSYGHCNYWDAINILSEDTRVEVGGTTTIDIKVVRNYNTKTLLSVYTKDGEKVKVLKKTEGNHDKYNNYYTLTVEGEAVGDGSFYVKAEYLKNGSTEAPRTLCKMVNVEVYPRIVDINEHINGISIEANQNQKLGKKSKIYTTLNLNEPVELRQGDSQKYKQQVRDLISEGRIKFDLPNNEGETLNDYINIYDYAKDITLIKDPNDSNKLIGIKIKSTGRATKITEEEGINVTAQYYNTDNMVDFVSNSTNIKISTYTPDAKKLKLFNNKNMNVTGYENDIFFYQGVLTLDGYDLPEVIIENGIKNLEENGLVKGQENVRIKKVHRYSEFCNAGTNREDYTNLCKQYGEDDVKMMDSSTKVGLIFEMEIIKANTHATDLKIEYINPSVPATEADPQMGNNNSLKIKGKVDGRKLQISTPKRLQLTLPASKSYVTEQLSAYVDFGLLDENSTLSYRILNEGVAKINPNEVRISNNGKIDYTVTAVAKGTTTIEFELEHNRSLGRYGNNEDMGIGSKENGNQKATAITEVVVHQQNPEPAAPTPQPGNDKDKDKDTTNKCEETRRDSRGRVTYRKTCYANGNVSRISTYTYKGNTRVYNKVVDTVYSRSTKGRIISRTTYTNYNNANKWRKREIVLRNENKANKVTARRTTVRHNNLTIKEQISRNYFGNGKFKNHEIVRNNNKGQRTYRRFNTYFSNGRVRSSSTWSNYRNNAHRRRVIVRRNEKGRLMTREVALFNNKKQMTSKTTYRYNNAGQLRTNKNGKAWRVRTNYRNGKRTTTVRRNYNSRGRLTK